MRLKTGEAICRGLNKFSLYLRGKGPELVSGLGGFLLTLSFPNWDIAGLAWVAPAFILSAVLLDGGRRPFRLGFIAGLVHFLSSLSWLLLIPYRWQGIPLGPAVGWLALSAYVALYLGAWLWLAWRFLFPVESSGAVGALAARLTNFSWLRRSVWAVFCGAAWVGLEMIRARLLGGFPWILLGTSQHTMLPIIQISSWTGVYGVSFLVVWFSASLFSCSILCGNSRRVVRLVLGEIAFPVLVMALVYQTGYRVIMHSRQGASSRILKAALVQPGIPQEFIWNENETTNRFNKLMELSVQAMAASPDLLVWPEAAMPAFTRENMDAIRSLIVTNRVWMIFGADDAEPRQQPGKKEEYDFYNAAFLFAPSGDFVATYRKRRLVMFGEYIPWSDWLPFLKWIVPIGNFAAGSRVVPFSLDHPEARTAVLICFEDVFPHHTGAYATADMDFLLNLTNDGWFGKGAAQRQQAVGALFRSVENRIPLIRCTNNGLTCWIDEFGRMREIFRARSGSIFDPGVLQLQIPLLPAGPKRVPTFYNAHGDWFGWICAGVTGFFGLFISRGKLLSAFRPAH